MTLFLLIDMKFMNFWFYQSHALVREVEFSINVSIVSFGSYNLCAISILLTLNGMIYAQCNFRRMRFI